jgi:hypothetical protein
MRLCCRLALLLDPPAPRLLPAHATPPTGRQIMDMLLRMPPGPRREAFKNLMYGRLYGMGDRKARVFMELIP